MTPPHWTDPAAALNHAAGVLEGLGDADYPFLNPAVPLRCLLAVSLLCRAGAVPDQVTPPTRPDTLLVALREAMTLIGGLPASVFDTDLVQEAVAAVMLAHEATG
jgi:hypothetical protein